jgi:SOS-response transcriptional repressor LexA
MNFEFIKNILLSKQQNHRFIMPKNSKQNKTKRTRQSVRVEGKAVRTLRTLSNQEAFYFYETIGKPTGQSAKSLNEFLDKIKSVKLESLVFHLQRKDFKNWISNTLEDPKLAQEIQTLPTEHKDLLRTKICTTVETRLKELEGTSVQVNDLYLSQSNIAR